VRGGAIAVLVGSLLLLPRPAGSVDAAGFSVGSKKFTESVVLGEIVRLLASTAPDLDAARHRRELGGTRVLFGALVAGELDAYVEYTGTIREELLAGAGDLSLAGMRRQLASQGIVMGDPLGFENTYAIGMQRERARRLGIQSLSDLATHPELPLGFTAEFMDRADGWPGLARAYSFRHSDVRGMDHDLAYRGLTSGALAATDLYSTDAEIAYYDLVALRDDRGYFPEYQAVLLYRADLEQRMPLVVERLRQLAGSISAEEMIAMNAGVKIERRSEFEVASEFVEREFGVRLQADDPEGRGMLWNVWRHTRAHLLLVGVSLGMAILIALPLGICSAWHPGAGRVILGVTGIVQSVPSLALLVFMIPFLGIGAPPAIAALCLYSLLPIVRNTHAGLTGIPLGLRESAEALGLPAGARLWQIELPLASRSILAGIKTGAVINIGTAPLGALIGAGGLGQPILTGIRLDDLGLILQGAVPAALLVLLAQGGFDALERVLVPEGLRLDSGD